MSVFEYCWEESIERWVEREREIREEYIDRRTCCGNQPWPFNWACHVFEFIRYIIRVIWESIPLPFNVIE
jgi:hypothetical protein